MSGIVSDIIRSTSFTVEHLMHQYATNHHERSEGWIEVLFDSPGPVKAQKNGSKPK